MCETYQKLITKLNKPISYLLLNSLLSLPLLFLFRKCDDPSRQLVISIIAHLQDGVTHIIQGVLPRLREGSILIKSYLIPNNGS
jgi:hypothetical protein